MTNQNFCGIREMIFTKVSANMNERMTDFHVHNKISKERSMNFEIQAYVKIDFHKKDEMNVCMDVSF